jgi:transposase
VVDRQGLPLHALLSPANRNDSVYFEAALDGLHPIKRPRGRPRQRPAKVHADKAYDIPRCHAYLRRRGITDRIARIGIESSERLGRVRWVAERTMAWFTDFRRLDVRYERRDDIHLAFLHLGCALICLRAVERL